MLTVIHKVLADTDGMAFNMYVVVFLRKDNIHFIRRPDFSKVLFRIYLFSDKRNVILVRTDVCLALRGGSILRIGEGVFLRHNVLTYVREGKVDRLLFSKRYIHVLHHYHNLVNIVNLDNIISDSDRVYSVDALIRRVGINVFLIGDILNIDRSIHLSIVSEENVFWKINVQKIHISQVADFYFYILSVLFVLEGKVVFIHAITGRLRIYEEVLIHGSGIIFDVNLLSIENESFL